MSMSWQRDVTPAPALLVLPPAAASLDEAHAAIELWEYYSGKTLDPTQRLVVEVLMAQRSDGRWAASTTGREMPRQNGKGDEIEVVELWGLVQRAERIMHTVHDAALLATQTQQRMLSVLDGHPDLRRRMERRHVGIGQQMIEMRNGGIIWYRTRTGGGGRGVDDIDRLVVDEAQHAAEEHLAAVAPTLLANPNSQLNAMGTAGLTGKSAWWWQIRKRALRPDPGDFGYVGHTAERVYARDDGTIVQEPVDVNDRSLWVKANPVLSSGRGQGIEFFEEQLRRLGPEAFAREHLGVWDPPPAEGGEQLIPAGVWSRVLDEQSTVDDPVTFCLDLSWKRDTFAFGVAGRSKAGGDHVELVEHGPHPGIDRLVARARELQDRHGGRVVLVAGSPAESLEEPLSAAGVDVLVLSVAEYVQACGDFFDAVHAGRVRHLGQAALDAAVAGVERRWVGEAWCWGRKASSTDITPLVAVTAARWASLHHQSGLWVL